MVSESGRKDKAQDPVAAPESLVTSIVSLVETGPVELGAYTVAELTAVDAIVDFLTARPSDEVLAEAIRSLAARKLLVAGDSPDQVEVRGDLGIAATFQQRARMVLDARGTGTEPGEPWRILLLPQPEAITMLVRIDALGIHEISLRKRDEALKALADWLPRGRPADPDAEVDGDAVLKSAERSALVTVTRYTAEKDDFETVTHDGIDTVAEAQEPLGFLIPSAWKEIADELALHGVQMERTTKPLDQEFDTWRFTDVKYAPAASEGGMMVDYNLHPVHERIMIPAGSYWVPMHQQRARLIMALLHPAAPDALLRWGFAGSIFQTMGRIGAAQYLTVPIANKVAEENPALMTEFQAKLKGDPKFAADPEARVSWWVARSNYQPSAVNRYPVVEVWEEIGSRK